MLHPLDLAPVFAGERKANDCFPLRYIVLGGLDPVSFLLGSVADCSLEEAMDESLASGWLCKARNLWDEGGGGVSPENVETLKLCFRKALSCRVSSRECFQLWYCLRALGSFPAAGVANSVLGVCLEIYENNKFFLMYCEDQGSSFGIWPAGSGRFSRRSEGEQAQLSRDILAAAQGGLETFSLSEEIPQPPGEGEFCLTVLTPAGWRTWRGLVAEGFSGPVEVCYHSFILLRGLFEGVEKRGQREEEELREEGFDFEDARWVYPSVWLRGVAFSVDLLCYLGPWAFIIYAWQAFFGGLTPVLMVYWGLLVAALFPFFLAHFESSKTHTSFGKRLFSLYVVSTVRRTGTTFYQALVRSFVKCYLSWSFGWLWGLCHPHGRMYHDVLLDTVVIQDEEEAQLLESLREQLEDDPSEGIG